MASRTLLRDSRDETWRLRDEIRERVQFEVMPIQAYLATLASGSVDAVFFRNVAINLTARFRRADLS